MDRPLDRKTEIPPIQAERATTSASIFFQSQLLATKCYVPIVSSPLISRPRLTALLYERLTASICDAVMQQKVLPLISHVWEASQHELIMFRQWLEQLPAEVVHSRPRLCLACVMKAMDLAESIPIGIVHINDQTINDEAVAPLGEVTCE